MSSSVPMELRDVRHLHHGGDGDGKPKKHSGGRSDVERRAARVEEAGDVGEWPEEAEYSVYADSSVTLPGFSERGVGCGEWAPREYCNACGDVHLGPHRCHQRGCPDCWSTWGARRAESITRRLQAARWSLPDGIERRVVHAVASPPSGEVTSLADVTRYRRKAIDRAKEAGVRGAVTVFHGFRVQDEVKRIYRAGDRDVGLWQWVREHDRGWRSLTYWSPHYHLLGLATEFEGTGEADEWVIQRLSTLSPFAVLRDREAYAAVAKTAQYLLSHATFDPEQSVKCVTWMGDVHPSNFTPDPIEAERRKRPPKIEAPSEGAYAVIERLSVEVTHSDGKEKAEGGLTWAPECEEEGCTGRLQPIWDAWMSLHDETFCRGLSREEEKRLRVAFEWAVGDVVPPPGLRSPRAREDAEEALAVLLS